MRRLLALAAVAVLATLAGACERGGSGSGHPGSATGATKAFLDALVANELESAFETTTLTVGEPSAPGVASAVTREHFVAVFETQPVSTYRVLSRQAGVTRVAITTPLGKEAVTIVESGGKVVVPSRRVWLDVEGGKLPGLEVAGVAVELPEPSAPSPGLPLATSAVFRYDLLVLGVTVEAVVPPGPVTQAQQVRLPRGERTVNVALVPAPGAVDAARIALAGYADSCGGGCEVGHCGSAGPVFRLGSSRSLEYRRERLVHSPEVAAGVYTRPESAAWVMTLEARATAADGLDRFDLLAVAEFSSAGGPPGIDVVCHSPRR